MSTAAKLAQLRRVQGQIDGLISAGKSYEAIRLIVTIANRYVASKAYDAAFQVTVDGALALLARGEASLGAQVGIHYISLLTKAKAELSRAVLASIEAIFAAFPANSVAETAAGEGEATPAAGGSAEDQAVRFMRAAIAHVAETPADNVALDAKPFSAADAANTAPFDAADAPKPETALYLSLAAYHAKKGDFAQASRAYLRARAPAQHAVALNKWMAAAPAGDAPLFLVRAVLQALAAGDKGHARKLVAVAAAQRRFDGAFQSAPLTHFADLFTQACELGSRELFQVLTARYSVALVRDPALQQLAAKAGAKFCGVQAPKSFLASLLGN